MCTIQHEATKPFTFLSMEVSPSQILGPNRHLLQIESLDPLDPDLPREIGDVGVQFAAWGQTTNRFYTGSSDGKVKAWNIKNPPGKAFTRNVLDIGGAVISGAFSKDFSKLLVGDATGKVYLMGINDSDLEGGPLATSNSNSSKESTAGSISNTSAAQEGSVTEIKLQQLLQQKNGILSRNIKRPKVVIPHKEPPPPESYELDQENNESSVDIAQRYLNEGWLEQRVGLGIYQGANYEESGWFDHTAHEDGDPERPLLPQFREEQQFDVRLNNNVEFDLLPEVKSSDPKQHAENMRLDLDLSRMSLETKKALGEERVEIEGDFAHTFSYELLPRTSIWSSSKKIRGEQSRSKIRKRSIGKADVTME